MQFGGKRGRQRPAKTAMPQCTENVDLIPPYNRARILLAYSSVLEWTAEELQGPNSIEKFLLEFWLEKWLEKRFHF